MKHETRTLTRTLMGFHTPRDGYGVGTIKLSVAVRSLD